MFDGGAPPGFYPLPEPRRPHALDTRALLPMVRLQASEVTVAFLAHAAAFNAIEAARWTVLTWEPGAEGILDPAHPCRAAWLDPSTPAGRAAEALASLAAACSRHRSITGRDGLPLAHSVMAQGFGAALADHVLKPLLDVQAAYAVFARETGTDIDTLVDGTEGLPRLDPKMPTLMERAAAVAEVLALAFADHRLGGLRALLDALQADDAANVKGKAGDATLAALGAVTAALQEAADQGVEVDEIQAALDVWADATGGPRIAVKCDTIL